VRLKAVFTMAAFAPFLEMLERPAGRKPERSIVELSGCHSLSDPDREKLMEVVQHAVHASNF
jgi:hypothetical protein